MSIFPAIRIEGGLLGPDTLELLLAGELPGQQPRDFGLDGRRSLTDEIAAVFADARIQWEIFRHRLERLPDTDSATSVTRDAWMIPFLSLLGYELRHSPRAYEVDGATFAISHRAGEHKEAPPVHVVGVRQELGRGGGTGRPRLAPHALVQEFLNRSEQLWGIVTNGVTLRLLRDSTYIRRQAYVEFDLAQIFAEQRFTDFAVLYRLLHRTRLPTSVADARDCLLEQYYQRALEQGGRVRERLREGVEACITRLANGFLAHPANDELRRRIAKSERHMDADGSPFAIPPADLYRQLLRLAYRFLFLLVAEERGLMSANPLYREHYGVARLRRLLDLRSTYTEHEDLWLSLRVLWKVLADEQLAPLLEVAPLNGELFAPLDLDTCTLTNRDLLEAFWHLAYYRESPSSPPRRVNYAALDVEELGSVYESLLDYHPHIGPSGAVPQFELVSGSERKSTGSYYTPPELVAELIRLALEPVLIERLAHAKTPTEKERVILSIRVLDPAAGSGHFLLAAARRLGKELARVRTGEDEPAPERVREAIREVVGHCIYGVDKDPLAVELCRVALWLESHAAGNPLTFLEHRIRCGDSLVGVVDLEVLERGLPDEAFDRLKGDDRQLAARLKRQNKTERYGQLTPGLSFNQDGGALARLAQELEAIPDDTPEQVRLKRNRYEARRCHPALRWQKEACDLWTAAFFQSLTPTPATFGSTPFPSPSERGEAGWGDGVRAITTDTIRRALAGQPVDPQTLAQAQALAVEVGFYHWPLEFPEVFYPHPPVPSSNPSGEGGIPHPRPLFLRERGESGGPGFDVVLGNPPWERIKLQEQEFFASRDARIAHAPNAAARKRLIARLPQENPTLWQEYRRTLHNAECTGRFLRSSGSYPLTGHGDINTYSVFAERLRSLLAPGGRAGIIVPTGIATGATNQLFFADLVEKEQLASLFDFENREAIFPEVHRSYKFCLLTARSPHPQPLSLRERGGEGEGITLSFFATRTEHLRDPRRVFTLTREAIARINPNTRTLPVFRTRQDAELTRAIYERVPVLVNERTSENPWGVHFLAMFHMSNDSHLFRSRQELEREGWRLVGNRFVRGDEEYLPLYEAKMIWQYDHRYGTYEGVADRSSTQLPTPNERQHANPHFLVRPWYWVPVEEVEARRGTWPHRWLLGWRDICRSTDERTVVANVIPLVGVGDRFLLMFSHETSPYTACLLADQNSLVHDYVARQKVGGVSLKYFTKRQIPILPPTAYTAINLRFIVPRVLELVYTAWDIKPFADDVWTEADEELRAAIRQQRMANSEWRMEEVDREGVPFPPFRWDEGRRARLRAELDAYYARLYGLTRKQLRYILDPADLTERELENILDPWEEVRDPLDPTGYAERCAKSDFPGETFRVLKEKERRLYGEYRTRRMVLEMWERMCPSPNGTTNERTDGAYRLTC